MSDAQTTTQPEHLRVGQPFNPFRLFTGIFIPEALVRSRLVSPGAKMAYGRLARYAGQHGHCYPAVATLGSEIGVGQRQAQKYLAELERAKLIRRGCRFSDRGQMSNAFEFLWHWLFEEGANDRSGEGVNDDSSPGVNDRSPKESQDEESHSQESHDERDLDCPPTNRKKRDSQVAAGFDTARPKPYQRLGQVLADYMMAGEDDERVYPSDRLLVDVVDAAGGATEQEVIQCITYLYNERRLRPGTKHGPRHFSWFKTVVADYFLQIRNRQCVFDPAHPGHTNHGSRCGLSETEFDEMTSAIE
jgi:hypothetical protein